MFQAVTSARQVFQTGRTKAIQWRMSQLKALYSMLETYESDICEALRKDLGRHPKESYAFEILGVKNDIATLLKRLPDLVKPERVPGHGIMNIFDRCEVRRQPYGVVLIISPWN